MDIQISSALPDRVCPALAELHQLNALYGHVIDRRMWDRLDEVYAVDGVYDGRGSGLGSYEGRAAIHEWFAGRSHPLHFVTNVFIASWSDDGRRAAGNAKYLVMLPDGAMMGGEYDDDYVFTAHGWRFQRRTSRTLAKAQGPSEVHG